MKRRWWRWWRWPRLPRRGASLPATNVLLRRRLGIRGELLLALVPTVVVLAVLAVVEAIGRQRVLFASLVASAFLIYLDPLHSVNRTRTLIVSQAIAACVGFVTDRLLGNGYAAAATAMVVTIVLLVLLDAMHPPAVVTSLIFALRIGAINDLALFGFALVLTATLVVLKWVAHWLLAHLD